MIGEELINTPETFLIPTSNIEAEPSIDINESIDKPEIRLAVIGNVDSGKSTLVGVLTKSVLDDGRGLARSLVFNFNHELENGRTSSIAHEIMGFDSKTGEQVSVSIGGDIRRVQRSQLRKVEWPNVVRKSDKIVTFIDLCGHEKYLKTTIFGLVGLYPDYAMIIVNANAGMQRMSKEHLGIAIALQIPVFVVVTKIDICPGNVADKSVDDLIKLLKSPAVKRLPMVIRGTDTDANVKTAAQALLSNRVCPIIYASSVTGEGIPQLRNFLSHIVPRCPNTAAFRSPSDPVEFEIDCSFNVVGVGVVVSGTQLSGTVRVNQQLLLGPDKTGEFRPVAVRSIQVKRVNAHEVKSGQTAAFSLRLISRKDHLRKNMIRKGMVLLDPSTHPKATWEFTAEVVIMHHATTIRPKYQAMVHCGVIRQSAKVISLTQDLLRTGDTGEVRFRFMYFPEYLTVGQTILFREGRTRGMGKIVSVG